MQMLAVCVTDHEAVPYTPPSSPHHLTSKGALVVMATASTLLCIGYGNMGSALVDRWAEGDSHRQITIVDVASEALSRAAARDYRCYSAVSEISPADHFDLVLLAIKPQEFPHVRSALCDLASRTQLLISILSGTSLAHLCDSTQGRVDVVRAMPNLAARIGKGATACFADPSRGDAIARSDAFFRTQGQVFWLSREEDFDNVTAVSGSGPAYVYLLVEYLESVAVALGLEPTLAAPLVRQTVIGAAALLEATNRAPGELRGDVTSKGGTTAAAMQLLTDPLTGLEPLLLRALQAASLRSAELARSSTVFPVATAAEPRGRS